MFAHVWIDRLLKSLYYPHGIDTANCSEHFVLFQSVSLSLKQNLIQILWEVSDTVASNGKKLYYWLLYALMVSLVTLGYAFVCTVSYVQNAVSDSQII